MIPRIVEAKYIGDFGIFLKFSDGTEGEIDLAGELQGEILRPLKEQAYFKKFQLNRELHTITWPNGADFALEFLYDKVNVAV